MTALKWKELPEDQKKELQQDFILISKLLRFQNNAKPETYQYIFDEKEGLRLWDLFVRRCNRNIFVMITENFFTIEQKGDLCINVLKDEMLYAPKE